MYRNWFIKLYCLLEKMEQNYLLHFFLVSFLLIFNNCSNSSSDKQITLSNGMSFKLLNGETNTDIDQYIINYYESYFNTDIENQIPLYKYIKHNKYEIFIGLPIGSNSSSTIQQKGEQYKNTDQLIYIDSLNNSIGYKIKNNYFTENLYLRDDNIKYFVFSATISDSISNLLFNSSTVSKRFFK